MDHVRYGSAAATLAALHDDPQHNRLLTLEFPRDDGPPDALMLANKLVTTLLVMDSDIWGRTR